MSYLCVINRAFWSIVNVPWFLLVPLFIFILVLLSTWKSGLACFVNFFFIENNIAIYCIVLTFSLGAVIHTLSKSFLRQCNTVPSRKGKKIIKKNNIYTVYIYIYTYIYSYFHLETLCNHNHGMGKCSKIRGGTLAGTEQHCTREKASTITMEFSA